MILEAGAFGTSADWDYILDDLSKGGRVCAYDRAGVGRSPDRPGDRGVLAKAGELNGLLDQLGETGKVILVGHSNGALYIEAFARLFPGRVAGLVYVNGVNATAADDPLLLGDLHTERQLSNLAALGARLGLAPLVAGKLTDDEHLSPVAAARKREALDCVPCLVVSRDEDRLDRAGPRCGEAARRRGGAPYPDRGHLRIALPEAAPRAGLARRRDQARGGGRPVLDPRRAGRHPRLASSARPGLYRRGRGLAADPHHAPTFGIDTHGSAGVSAGPAWSSSMEMPSGERTKAIRPSRGGRLMTTPPSFRRWQVAWMSSTA